MTAPVLPVPEVDPEEVRRAADEIVARSELRPPEPGVLEHVLQWLGDRLDDLLGAATGSGEGSGVLGWVVLVVTLVAVALLLVRAARRVQAEAGAGPAVAADVERTWRSRDWTAAAEELEAAGSWKEALRCRYRALVGALVEREVLDDVPGRTTGEYRMRVVDEHPEVAAPFEAATELFEAAWYADATTGPEENRRFRADAGTVLERVR